MILQAWIEESKTRSVVPNIFFVLSATELLSERRGIIQTSWIARPSKAHPKCASPFMDTGSPAYRRQSSSQLPTSQPYASAASGISGERSVALSTSEKLEISAICITHLILQTLSIVVHGAVLSSAGTSATV